MQEHCRDTSEMFGTPEFRSKSLSVGAGSDDVRSANQQHAYVLQNFIDGILDDTPLVTPAREGLDSLHLANGILLSAWCGEPVDLPLDAPRFERELQQRIAQASLRTPSPRTVDIDMDKSYR